jgi:hypothetical protein
VTGIGGGGLLHPLEPGEAGDEDRGLGEAGALGHAGEGVLADDLYGEVDQVGPDGQDVLAHVRRLAGLSWEDDGGRHVRESQLVIGPPLQAPGPKTPHVGGSTSVSGGLV